MNSKGVTFAEVKPVPPKKPSLSRNNVARPPVPVKPVIVSLQDQDISPIASEIKVEQPLEFSLENIPEPPVQFMDRK
jgi:hypothetical protein